MLTMCKSEVKSRLKELHQRKQERLDLRHDDFISKFKSKFGDDYTFEKTKYVNKHTPVTVTCLTHGDVQVSPSNLFRANKKTACIHCGGRRTQDDFIQEAIRKHKGRYDYSNVKYVNMMTPVEIICSEHGPFMQAPDSHIRKGYGCDTCARTIPYSILVRRFKKLHDGRYIYPDRQKRAYSEDYIDIKCPTHGWFKQQVKAHAMGCGCPKCHLDKQMKSVEDFIKDAKAIHGDVYDYSKVEYKGNKVKVEIVCSTHGSFFTTPNAHLTSKAGCPKCRESKGELRVRRLLEKVKLPYIQEFKIKGYKYRYDFHITGTDVLIEYHGKQHYHPVKRFGGEVALMEVKERDAIKRDIAKAHGYSLLTINYRHWDNRNLEATLIKKLLKRHAYWMMISDKLVTFDRFLDVCKFFNLPGKTTVSEVHDAVKLVNPKVEFLLVKK